MKSLRTLDPSVLFKPAEYETTPEQEQRIERQRAAGARQFKIVMAIWAGLLVVLALICLGQINNRATKAQRTSAVAAQTTPAVPAQIAPAKPIEYPAPSDPTSCPVAMFGTKGCNELQRLYEDIEDNRPCLEMSRRGMQAEARRCFKETRELQRDIR